MAQLPPPLGMLSFFVRPGDEWEIPVGMSASCHTCFDRKPNKLLRTQKGEVGVGETVIECPRTKGSGWH